MIGLVPALWTAIAAGEPASREPNVEPRDTRKTDPDQVP